MINKRENSPQFVHMPRNNKMFYHNSVKQVKVKAVKNVVFYVAFSYTLPHVTAETDMLLYLGLISFTLLHQRLKKCFFNRVRQGRVGQENSISKEAYPLQMFMVGKCGKISLVLSTTTSWIHF